MARPTTASISPFFIVSDVGRTIAFYCGKLGFEVTFQEPDQNPFFAIVRRDGAQLFVKAVDEKTPPLPNSRRHPSARWDAYVYAPDPDALAAEFTPVAQLLVSRYKIRTMAFGASRSMTLTVMSCFSAGPGSDSEGCLEVS